MNRARRHVVPLLAVVACGCLVPCFTGRPDPGRSRSESARALAQRQPGSFAPNLGQWDDAAKFVHRSGAMTLYLMERGWVVDLVEPPARTPRGVADHAQKTRGVALRMTFDGDAHVPEIVGENELAGHHNYFLDDDESRWRTGVPLYGSVRYEDLYPGIDLRLREAKGVPEYDLFLRPGADLARVRVRVEGAEALVIADDGALVIETALGPLTQSKPTTWQVDRKGTRREIACNFEILGADCFGFDAPGWDGRSDLTIDPGLIWSTFVGAGYANTVAVEDDGVVTVAGTTESWFPTTVGAYNRTVGGTFVSRLDPQQNGTAQLTYSTFLGLGIVFAISVDEDGVVTAVGRAVPGFPTTRNAFDRTHGGRFFDGFVSRLDTRKVGAAQLVYSTFLGGSGDEIPWAVSAQAGGVLTVAGETTSADFPTTRNAYDTTHNGENDVFVSRLDTRKVGSAQLTFSTLLGGSRLDRPFGLDVDSGGIVTVAGGTASAGFPTTSGAFDPSWNGGSLGDAFVSRLDPSRSGVAQLVYSTFLGGRNWDHATEVCVGSGGVLTVAGMTESPDYPATTGAYDTTFNGPANGNDAFVSRLDPSKRGSAQLTYSSFLGGDRIDSAEALHVDPRGVVTVGGFTASSGFPTTSGAYDTTHNGELDGFVSRLDPGKKGVAQLVHSTFLGGRREDFLFDLTVDPSGATIVAGHSSSPGFPTTSGAYSTKHSGRAFPWYFEVFTSRLGLGLSMWGDVHEISTKAGGTQRLTIDAGIQHANKLYRVFGSSAGTHPGLDMLGIHIPLNVDVYTHFTIRNPRDPIYRGFIGTLDANGRATASVVLPPNLPPLPPTFHHACVVYDAVTFRMASNPVQLNLK